MLIAANFAMIPRLLASGCVALGAVGLFLSPPSAHFAPPATPNPVADTVDHPPPPGTARVRGSVQSCEDATPPQQCTIQIRVVTAYGVNTPPIADGSRTVQVRSPVLDTRSVDSLRAAESWHMTLVHAGPQIKTPGRETDSSPAWTLTRVNRRSDDQ